MTDDISKTIDEIIERYKGTLDLLAKDDGPELRPCPCGCKEQPVVYDHDGTSPKHTKWIRCPGCGRSTDAATYERCVEQWNKRVSE